MARGSSKSSSSSSSKSSSPSTSRAAKQSAAAQRQAAIEQAAGIKTKTGISAASVGTGGTSSPTSPVSSSIKSRLGESTTINKITNEIVGAKSGKVYGKGSSLAEALAIQNQVTGGSTPTVAGRPDLYAPKPLTGEGQSFNEPSTRTTVTPRTATADELSQKLSGTLESFNKSQGLTYLDGNTFESIQANLSESDLVRGPEGQIWLKQGLTVEDVQARTPSPVDVSSELVGTTDLVIDVPDLFDSETYDDAFNMPTTDADIQDLIEDNQALQSEYLEALQPTDLELDLQQQIADVDTQINNYLASFESGLNAIEDEVIPMSFITGQQASLERRAQADLANLTRYQDALAKRLGIEQENRKTSAESALAAVNFGIQNIQLALQIKEAINAQQDRVLARVDKMRSESRDTLSTLLSMFQGIDYADLSPDLQNQLNSLATSSGIPSDLLMKGMETVKNQMIQAQLEKSRSSAPSQTDEEKKRSDFQNDVGDMILKLDTGEYSWGGAWDYIKAKYNDIPNSVIDSYLGGGYDMTTGQWYGRAQ